MADHATKVTARMFDFLHRRTPWHRRLWAPGTVLGLHEVVEYSRLRREAGLPPEGINYVASTMRREVARDPGSAPFIDQLDPLLDLGHRMVANDENRLEHLADRVDGGYLTRWETALGSPNQPGVERTARSVASHLLDKGFSSDHLYRWLDADQHHHDAMDLGRILAQATTMCSTTAARVYEVVVPCIVPAQPTRLPRDVQWMDAPATAAWLEANRPDVQKPRQGGAFVIRVTERDPWSAVEAANELIARIAARVQVGRPGTATLRPADVAYVVGNDRNYRLQPPRRQLDIHALHRQDAVFDVNPADSRQLDDALELAAYLETGSAGAAITGGWAAIEGLLLHPGERGHHVAADRLARIVACSVSRAELTPLAFEHQQHGGDDLAAQLNDFSDTVANYERVRLVESHLRSGGTLVTGSANDEAAVDRVAAIVAQPAVELRRIEQYAQETFRRLYNQRNLVMHGGSFRSVALPVTLRTAPPLVGAGLDRIVHAYLGNEQAVAPLALSARAEAELAMLGTGAGSWIVDLLGR